MVSACPFFFTEVDQDKGGLLLFSVTALSSPRRLSSDALSLGLRTCRAHAAHGRIWVRVTSSQKLPAQGRLRQARALRLAIFADGGAFCCAPGTSPDAIQYVSGEAVEKAAATTMSACSRALQWQLSLALLDEAPPQTNSSVVWSPKTSSQFSTLE